MIRSLADASGWDLSGKKIAESNFRRLSNWAETLGEFRYLDTCR
ncbi:hypothetical protein RMSM_01781 [Rhodopirellula maiorica SM1]|uniref:Uncharacterized protein n=1 Tax=Rhodopirellula maiorica SM1 TaxID=1265738 RepID=M5RQ29_9BACT|nr:hypothetical protein RMSM_01781 [Rhodopirellula maiorica SM1]